MWYIVSNFFDILQYLYWIYQNKYKVRLTNVLITNILTKLKPSKDEQILTSSKRVVETIVNEKWSMQARTIDVN